MGANETREHYQGQEDVPDARERARSEKEKLIAEGWRKLNEYIPADFVPKPRHQKRSVTRLKWRQVIHMRDANVQHPQDRSKAPKGYIKPLEALLACFQAHGQDSKKTLKCERRYERAVAHWYNLRVQEGHLPRNFGRWA